MALVTLFENDLLQMTDGLINKMKTVRNSEDL
jgi:hypothetical protein